MKFRDIGEWLLMIILAYIIGYVLISLSYYPWLVVPLLCTYYLSKYYYWHRFDLHYPTFLVDND